MNGSPLANVKSTDYRDGKLHCNVCNEFTYQLVKINERWACAKCNKVMIGPGRARLVFVHRTVNDLLDYFGEINSECLFDSKKLQGFVNFVGLDKRVGDYTLFLMFVRKILMKEVGSLGILEFLDSAQKNIKKLSQPKNGVDPPTT